MSRFPGRTALVTGGASGIGRATVERLVAAGANVAVIDRNIEALDSLLAKFGADRIIPIAADVGVEEEVRRAVALTVAQLGRIDHCVTAAGIFLEADAEPLEGVSFDTFSSVLRVNLFGTFLVVREVLPQLRAQAGSAVLVSSTAAISGHGLGAGYTSSKGGITALTRLLAVQYARHGVRVNCIAPGATNTPMAKGRYQPGYESTPSGVGKPITRLGEPDDVAAAITFLLSSDAAQMTGQVLAVDGGFVVGVNRMLPDRIC
jgi:NAD(P)-dependent dehydrogenase (short-subunit alcohol dehydrogenase family)